MKQNNRYRVKMTTFIVAIIICLLIVYINLLSHNRTQKIYLEQTEKTIIKMKKDFLNDTVNNVFIEIDKLRAVKYSNYKKNTEYRLSRIQEELDLTDKDFTKFFIDKFENDPTSSMWTALLWDNKTGQILYDSSKLNITDLDSGKEDLKLLLSSHSIVEKGNLEAIFGVKTSYIDDVVKNEIEDAIRTRKFSNNSYMWINEVINYEGGKNYAIRKVHPNLTEEEGSYLSTDIKDSKGNLPYLKELNGINKDGELFFNYSFKELNSSKISEKISYAKLYKDFNWIIAMGVHFNEIDAYAEKINAEALLLSSEASMKLLKYIFIVLLIGFTSLYFLEKRNFLSSTQYLEKKINIDSLTNTFSRRYGEKSLNSLFDQYKLTGENPAIMIFDLDSFKQINDKYGHESGDIVLIEVVNIINRIIRSSDQLIRWGGDEFIGIFPGLKKDYLIQFAQGILDEISSTEISVIDGTIKTSVSIGFSYFETTDKDYTDVLKRADDAMYKSKKEGKNRVKLK